MFGTLTCYATTTGTSFTKENENVTKVILYNVKKGQFLFIKNTTGKIIHKELIKITGSVSQGFNFSSLENGYYTLEINKDYQIDVKPFTIISGQAIFHKKAEKTTFKPVMRNEKNLVLISKLNFDFIESDLNTLKNREHNFAEDLNEDFILLHFDEKWIYDDYISDYTNIEPLKDELISFIDLLLTVTNKRLVITTGIRSPKILNDIINIGLNSRVKVYKKLDFLDLEILISKSKLLISCHGSVSHVAAAHKIKQIDITEEKHSNFYSKWTHHFRNYHSIHRKPFDQLSLDIIKLL